jgi:hypothetical protein
VSERKADEKKSSVGMPDDEPRDKLDIDGGVLSGRSVLLWPLLLALLLPLLLLLFPLMRRSWSISMAKVIVEVQVSWPVLFYFAFPQGRGSKVPGDRLNLGWIRWLPCGRACKYLSVVSDLC